jgi:hypothetical protein
MQLQAVSLFKRKRNGMFWELAHRSSFQRRTQAAAERRREVKINDESELFPCFSSLCVLQGAEYKNRAERKRATCDTEAYALPSLQKMQKIRT